MTPPSRRLGDEPLRPCICNEYESGLGPCCANIVRAIEGGLVFAE